nr:ATP-dependent Clp protease proteolytic subunit [Lachnospiraceae bacterium]
MNDYLISLCDNNEVMGDEKVSYRTKWVPAVTEETCEGIREIQLQTRHFNNGKLFITGEVTDDMADTFVSEMLYLAEKGEPVDIYINSPGGSVSA